jgi:LDH2 family malate/lactate/ureidoglycolate dehydrogenase
MKAALVNTSDLKNFVASVLMKNGVSPAGSQVAADVLLFADSRGIHSHGVGNLHRIYLPRIRSGAIVPSAEPRMVADHHAVCLIDAQHGLGIATAPQAMEEAIRRAQQFGIGAAAVRGSSHFGSAGYYAVMAERRGMVGMAFSNLGSQTIARHPDGRMALCGTNPLSVAAPSEQHPAFALDMSTTAVSTGKVRSAMRRGETTPPGWLVDDEGGTVTDPARYFERTAHLQFLGGDGPSGGYKGFGLALMVDLLAGILPGAYVGPDSRLFEPGGHGTADQDIGHLFLALDIAKFRPLGEFRADLDRMLSAVLQSPGRPGRPPAVYPGYPEAAAAAQLPPGMVSVEGDDLERLAEIAREFASPLPQSVEWNS